MLPEVGDRVHMTTTRTPAANCWGAGSGWRPTRPAGALASQWRGPAKRSTMQSIPDRYFAEAAAFDSVGIIAT
jgi:hypothetical protein